jgi:Reverse transcriptase (RNA-dependent DNA polymerase)
MSTGILKLIPKKPGGGSIDTFRPITMLNTDYKIISKAIALRLSPHMKKLVSNSQYGFVPGKDIRTPILVACAKLEKAELKGKSTHVVLIDFTKAFDSIRHEFLIEALKWHKIPNELVNQIETLISKAQVYAVHGEVRTNNIPVKRGVRQGCPLSPFLFIFAIDALLRAIQANLGTHEKGERLVAFADDVTVFLGDDPRELEMLRRCIKDFENASGCVVNMNKTLVLSSHKRLENSPWTQLDIGSSTRLLGVQVGCPSGENKRCTEVMKKLVELCRKSTKLTANIMNKIYVANAFIVGSIQHHLYFRLFSQDQLKTMQQELITFVVGKVKRFSPGEVLLCTKKRDGGLGLANVVSKSAASTSYWACAINSVPPKTLKRTISPNTPLNNMINKEVAKHGVVHSGCKHTFAERYDSNLYSVLAKRKANTRTRSNSASQPTQDATLLADLKNINKKAKDLKLSTTKHSLLWKLRANKAPQLLEGKFQRAKCTRCPEAKPDMAHLLFTCEGVKGQYDDLQLKLHPQAVPTTAERAINTLQDSKLKVWTEHALDVWKQYWAIILIKVQTKACGLTPAIINEPQLPKRLMWVDCSNDFT